MEEWVRTASPAREAERKRAVEERIKTLKRQKRARGRARRKSPAWVGMRIALVLLAVIFLVSMFHSLWSAVAFSGDTTVYSDRIGAANAADLQPYTEKSTAAISEPQIAATSAILVDGGTNQVLYEKNADKQLANASTTKVLTGIIVLDRCNLQDRVTVSNRAASTPEQSIWLKEGEVLTVEQLLNALLIQSANDAAVALAEYVAGSVESFAEIMNQTATGLGATNSNFVTPNGLDDPNHHTSARDLALITSYAMRNPEFRKIITTESYEIPWPDNPWSRVCENHNKLLDIYSFATGVKTGYTNKAGKCLVGSASKNGRELISVVLNGGDNYFNDTVSLMEYGFNDFVQVVYARAGEELFQAEVGNMPESATAGVPLNDVTALVRKDQVATSLDADLLHPVWLDYPVEEGQEIGSLVINVNGKEVQTPLVAACAVENPGFFSRAWAFFHSALTLE